MGKQKAKYTTSYTPEVPAQIGQYATENSNGAAVRIFKARHNFEESTLRMFKIMYLDKVKKQKEGVLTKATVKKSDRKVLPGE